MVVLGIEPSPAAPRTLLPSSPLPKFSKATPDGAPIFGFSGWRHLPASSGNTGVDGNDDDGGGGGGTGDSGGVGGGIIRRNMREGNLRERGPLLIRRHTRSLFYILQPSRGGLQRDETVLLSSFFVSLFSFNLVTVSRGQALDLLLHDAGLTPLYGTILSPLARGPADS